MSSTSDAERTLRSPSLEQHELQEKAAEQSPPPAHDEEKAITESSADSATQDPSQHPTDLSPPTAEAETHVQPSVLAPENLQRYAEGFTDQPPPLPFSAWNRKLSITIFWFFILAETCFIPVSFYYGLWFGTTLNHGACKLHTSPSLPIHKSDWLILVFAIITSVFGFVSGYEYGCRGYLLLLPRDNYRPLFSSPRFWGFDSLQYLLLTPYTVLTGVLIGGSIPTEPLTRILAMPMALGNIIMGLMFIISGIAVHYEMKLKHFRLSSHLKGSVCPPITYCIIEDVVAVDAGAGKVYREALMQRYNASPRFRTMLIQVMWFWGPPSVIVGVILLALIFTVNKHVAYGLGWAIPNIWAVIWTVLTILWVRRSLRIEKELWREDHRAPP